MPSKNPIRIGLTKQRSQQNPVPDDELVDEIDNTVPLSNSVMEALEKIVQSDASEDLFGDELECDQDPDYIQPEDNEQQPEHGPSRLRGKTLVKQPALNLVTTVTTTRTGNGKG